MIAFSACTVSLFHTESMINFYFDATACRIQLQTKEKCSDILEHKSTRLQGHLTTH